ncbi:putative Ubiquitin-conjugating enzyme E2 7 [Paratrimastix pyriformis]|uniref:Ubiquitin-conjugating enzyme E2 7 n=1 Tax=Paratrimastix pyriformis TaxID=342808 RepID=A0ABQ8URL3_9EUKA|nr:putative Ubiquitin-conjugating enzyme E2 7 [Paratrimastix pyriformis]
MEERYQVLRYAPALALKEEVPQEAYGGNEVAMEGMHEGAARAHGNEEECASCAPASVIFCLQAAHSRNAMSSNFARKLMEKYGWAEGKGLGKQEQGMVKHIPGIKQERIVGGDSTKTDWWAHGYDQALSSIQVKADVPEVIATRQEAEPERAHGLVKSDRKVSTIIEREPETEQSNPALGNGDDQALQLLVVPGQELLKMCGGLRARSHHPIGKLRRVEMADQMHAQRVGTPSPPPPSPSPSPSPSPVPSDSEGCAGAPDDSDSDSDSDGGRDAAALAACMVPPSVMGEAALVPMVKHHRHRSGVVTPPPASEQPAPEAPVDDKKKKKKKRDTPAPPEEGAAALPADSEATTPPTASSPPAEGTPLAEKEKSKKKKHRRQETAEEPAPSESPCPVPTPSPAPTPEPAAAEAGAPEEKKKKKKHSKKARKPVSIPTSPKQPWMAAAGRSQAALILAKQLQGLQKHPIEGISVGLIDDDNIFRWQICIVGPPQSMYDGGIFQGVMEFPPEFPNKPPSITFTSQMWHPNIYSDGRVCMSILHPPGDDEWGYESSAERWRPINSVESVLISLLALLSDPNDESPANVDASVMWRNNKPEFRRRVAHTVRLSQEAL